MESKKEIVPMSVEEMKKLKFNINMSLLVFILIFLSATVGTYLGNAPIAVPIISGIILIAGTVAMAYINKAVKKDIQSGKKEIITGKVTEKGRWAINGSDKDEYYIIGSEKFNPPFSPGISVNDIVEVHIAPFSRHIFQFKKIG
jgi:hypothetical protein